jgi:hypothetical protein
MGEAVPHGGDHARALGRAQHGDGEVRSLEAQDGIADGHRHHRGQHGRHREGGQPRPAVIAHEDGAGIGADSVEGDVAERGVAGEAADDVPGEGEDDVHHGEQGERAEVDAQTRRQEREDDADRDQEGEVTHVLATRHRVALSLLSRP